jgi:hypothetical protein
LAGKASLESHPEEVRSIEKLTREERGGRREEEEIEEPDIEPSRGGGRSVVNWEERHSRAQSQARADDGRTEARPGLSAAAAIGELKTLTATAENCLRKHTTDGQLLAAGERRDAATRWSRQGGESIVGHRLGAQGAQGAERGGWDRAEDGPRRGVIAVQHARPASTEAGIVIGHASNVSSVQAPLIHAD